MATNTVTQAALYALLEGTTSDRVWVTQAALYALVEYRVSPTVRIYTENTSTAAPELSTLMKTWGWLVNVRDDATLLTDTDINDYDALIGYRLTDGKGDDLRSVAETAGLPYALFMYGTGTATGTGLSTPSTDAYLTGTIEGVNNSTDIVTVTNGTHPITNEFGTGDLTYADGSAVYCWALDVGQSYVGTALAEADDANTNFTTGQRTLIAIEAGTDDLQGTPVATTERALVWGFVWGEELPSGITADGSKIIENAFTWLLSSRPLTPDIETVTPDATSADLTSNSFAHMDADRVHSSSRWQVTLQTDTTWSSIEYDSGYTSDLTAHTAIGLVASTNYMVRVLHRDDLGEDSNWSASVNFTTTDYGGGTTGVAGYEIEFYTSGDVSLGSTEVVTESTSYVELLSEGLTIPATTAYIIVRPIKRGTTSGGAAVKEVYLDRGNYSRKFEPYPFRPEVHTDEVIHAAHVTSPASATDADIDWSLARHQTKTLDDSPTLTFTGMELGTYVLRLVQDGTGSRTVTWPGAVEWAGGTAPTLTTTAGAEDVIRLTKTTDTLIVGDVVALNAS